MIKSFAAIYCVGFFFCFVPLTQQGSDAGPTANRRTSRAAINAATVTKAKAYFDNDDYVRCIAVCNAIVKGNPRNAEALSLRAWASIMQRLSHGESVGFLPGPLLQGDLATAVKIAPNSLLVRKARLYVATVEGDNDIIIKDATKIIELSPSDADAYFQRGRALNYLARCTEAIRDYEQAQKLGCSHPSLAEELEDCRKK